ncbi:hypothetical protein HanRHA438_Chr02g0064261 [Helianthus annuus]|nr:hypothetical protein HanRHA438_Chr02g0064261 [Helianthus annuus]
MSETNLLLHLNRDCLCGISIISKLYSQKYSLICSHMGILYKTNIYFVNH